MGARRAAAAAAAVATIVVLHYGRQVAADCSASPAANTFYCTVDVDTETADCWCWEGYWGTPFTLTCSEGTWEPAPENVCTGCSDPTPVPAAERVLSSLSPWGPPYQHVYDCAAGYHAPYLTSTCQTNASSMTWLPFPDTCTECNVPTAATLPPGVVVLAVATHRVGGVDAPYMATMGCGAGWVGVTVNATCVNNTAAETWAPLPACVAVPTVSPTPSATATPTSSATSTGTTAAQHSAGVSPTPAAASPTSAAASTTATRTSSPSTSPDSSSGAARGGGGGSGNGPAIAGGVIGAVVGLACCVAGVCLWQRRRWAAAQSAQRTRARMTPLQRILATIPHSDSNVRDKLLTGTAGGGGGDSGGRATGVGSLFGRGGAPAPAPVPSLPYDVSDADSVADSESHASAAPPPYRRPLDAGTSTELRSLGDDGGESRPRSRASFGSAATGPHTVVLDARFMGGGGAAGVAGVVTSPSTLRLASLGASGRGMTSMDVEGAGAHHGAADARHFSLSGIGDKRFYGV